MNDNSLLIENEKKRLTLRLPLLICFAMFNAWQMGAIYFSGQTMSVDGRTPLPVNVDDVTVIIAAGYILSILVMIFLPRIIVWTDRLTCAVALASGLALFLPLSPDTLVLVLYIHFFCCCFMVGFETAIIVGLFTEKTAILHLTLAYGVGLLFVAVLHNGLIAVPFSYFRVFTVAACAMQLLFYFKLPGNVWPESVKKSDKLVAPKNMFGGIFLWVVMGCMVILFGVAVAETVPYGVGVYYLSSALGSIAIFLLWKCFGISPLSVFPTITVMGALGFIAAITSLYIPGLALVSCVLLGTASFCCWLNPLFGILLAKKYPSRFISPAIIGASLVAVLTHTVLLDTFRGNTAALYLAYIGVAVSMIVLYLLLMPYLLYSFRGRTFQDIIGVVADEKEEITESKEKRPPLLIPKDTVKPVVQKELQKELPPHERRMKNLVSRSVEPLTRREYQVVDCIMRGMRRAEIAKELILLPESVSKYTKKIYDKFDIHSRQELFKLAETLEKEQLSINNE